MEKDVASYKIKLAAEAERITIEHQVRFTRLHEKRTYVIATVFAALERVHAALRQWGTLRGMGMDKARLAATFESETRAARDKLTEFYYPRAIWLDQGTCDRINHIIDTLSTLLALLEAEAKGVKLEFDIGGTPTDRTNEVTTELLATVGAARAELDKTFRGILEPAKGE